MKSIHAPKESQLSNQIDWKRLSRESLTTLSDDLHRQADEVSLFSRLLEKASASRELLKEEVIFQRGRFRGVVEAIEAVDLLMRKIHPDTDGSVAFEYLEKLAKSLPEDPVLRAKKIAELDRFSGQTLSLIKTKKGKLQLNMAGRRALAEARTKKAAKK